MKISLVIPAYNESVIIKNTVQATAGYLRNNFSDYELIIVDDGSTDDTAALVLACARDDENIGLISYDKNCGKGYAVRQGMLEASGDIVIYTDADLAYGLDVIKTAVESIGDNDVIIGSRRMHEKGYGEYTFIRHFASRVFGFLVRIMSGMDNDTQCGFKCFKSAAAYRVFSLCESDGFAFDFEVMMYCRGLKLKVSQMPVCIVNHRQSKVRIIRDSVKMFRDIIRIRKSVTKTLREVAP